MKIQKETSLLRLLKIINGTEFLSVFFHLLLNKNKKILNWFLVLFINKPPAVALPTEQKEV